MSPTAAGRTTVAGFAKLSIPPRQAPLSAQRSRFQPRGPEQQRGPRPVQTGVGRRRPRPSYGWRTAARGNEEGRRTSSHQPAGVAVAVAGKQQETITRGTRMIAVASQMRFLGPSDTCTRRLARFGAMAKDGTKPDYDGDAVESRRPAEEGRLANRGVDEPAAPDVVRLYRRAEHVVPLVSGRMAGFRQRPNQARFVRYHSE